MKKKNLFVFPVTVLALSMLLSGCGKKAKSEMNFDYLPVQMSKGESWSIIDKDGKEVVKEEYPAEARLSLIYDGAYWVYSNDKCQLYNIDNPKKAVIDEEFAAATDFKAGVAVVGSPNQPIRIIDAKGKIVAQLGKDIKRCYAFSRDGYAVIRNTNDKEGLIDTKGNIVIAPTYNELFEPNDGLVLAKKGDDDKKMLILNIKGEKQGEINLEKYELLNRHFSEGKLAVRNADDVDAPTIILNDKGEKLFEIKKAKERYYSAVYLGGYLTFSNGETIGVADENGEVVIRPKYKHMLNLSNGSFAASKDDKWGIIDANDEVIIDFDYNDFAFLMGDNYVLKDGSSWALVGKDGKELTSFAEFVFRSVGYVEYVDVTGITTAVCNYIVDYEQAFTPAQLAKKLSLSLDDYHYSSRIGSELDVDGKATVSLTSWYDGSVAEEKTHQEEVNDGWFTTTRTVSDGWNWNTEVPSRISGTVELKESSINLKDFYKALLAKMSEGRTKVSDNVFTKNIKVNGSTIECRTTLEQNYSNVGIEIVFRK